MDEVSVNKNTRWECQSCAKCCSGIIMDKEKSLSVIKEGKVICKNLQGKLCGDYPNRPFICRLYPFVIELDDIVDEEGVARPQRAFELERLKIHTDCCGFGKGKRVYANKRLKRELDEAALEFAESFKESFDKKTHLNL